MAHWMARQALCLLGLSAAVVAAASGPLDAAAALPELQLYDCNVEYEIWRQAWTPEWKSWCCQHRGRGCPSTSTSTSTRTSVTSTSTTSRTSTTRTTTTHTATTSFTLTATTTRTGTTTSSETLTISTTTRTSRTSTATSTTTTAPPCEQNCSIDGVRATCGSRIRWGSQHMTAKEKNPCEAAQVLVVSQCADECGSCSPQDARCDVEAQPSAAYHFRKKFLEEQRGVVAEARSEVSKPNVEGAGHLLPIHTTVGVMAAFAFSALLAFVFRRPSSDRTVRISYQNLLHQEDLGVDSAGSSDDMES